jgi:hypothetical protein
VPPPIEFADETLSSNNLIDYSKDHSVTEFTQNINNIFNQTNVDDLNDETLNDSSTNYSIKPVLEKKNN